MALEDLDMKIHKILNWQLVLVFRRLQQSNWHSFKYPPSQTGILLHQWNDPYGI